MNFGSNYVTSMVLIQRVYWRSMQEMVMIVKMCFSTKQMMSIISRVLYSLISNLESLTVSRMVYTAISIIQKTSTSLSMVVVLVTTGLEVLIHSAKLQN
jgi:hypothetical protein